jgi:uncharacterized protein (TIGR03435 family)
MSGKLLRIVVILISLSGIALAQSTPGGRGELSFEVASIKPTDPRSTKSAIGSSPGGRLSVSGVTIKNLISLAFHVPMERVVGAPSWLDSVRYDIEAKPAAGTTSSKRPAGMEEQWSRIRSLLADRCSLRVHRATTMAPVYELYIAPKGLRMLEAKGEERKSGNPGIILPWSMFISDLEGRLGRPVIDKTVIKGNWYIKLQYASDDGSPHGLGVRVDPDCDSCQNWPPILAALQDQLGLKAVSARGPVDALVIDSVSRPSEN